MKNQGLQSDYHHKGSLEETSDSRPRSTSIYIYAILILKNYGEILNKNIK